MYLISLSNSVLFKDEKQLQVETTNDATAIITVNWH